MIINLLCVHNLEHAEVMTWDLKVYSCQNVPESSQNIRTAGDR